MVLNEVRKEDDIYYQGPFWIVGDSVVEILRGNFSLVGEKYPVDYEGRSLEVEVSKNAQSHKNTWKREYASKYKNLPYNYFPRGRVTVYQGLAFIHLHSLMNTPAIVNKIIQMYELNKLQCEVELNDEIQGAHYDFLLGRVENEIR